MQMSKNPDVLVIGSGIGGATLAHRLVERGLNVTILERGGYLPVEKENWDVDAIFFKKRYVPRETWLDKKGKEFRPGNYYYVGGSSKLFGGTMLRLREKDFAELEHADGVSPAWPITYEELAPYYDLAEKLYLVHGDVGTDPTEPHEVPPYPYPGLSNEPAIEQVASALRKQGVHPFALPLAIQRHQGGACIRCKTCDGFPCKVHAKTDAEVAAIRPALATGKLELKTNSKVIRILLSADGRRAEAVEYQTNGSVEILHAPIIVLAASAVNSAALLLRSACDKAPKGAANSADVVGRYYMTHVNTALMSVDWNINPTQFQKTICINDYYFGDANFKYPMGNIQSLGKLQSGMIVANQTFLPKPISDMLAARSVDWWIMSEDLPERENRVVLQGNKIRLNYTENNHTGHKELVKRSLSLMRGSGFKLNITKHFPVSVSHQCGTVRFGNDPATAALNEYCRTYDHDNLFVVDSSFFPASGAVNPALTIAAMGIRVADHIAQTDFSVESLHRV
jgi:choline dehydrogenase-like flavoprotein